MFDAIEVANDMLHATDAGAAPEVTPAPVVAAPPKNGNGNGNGNGAHANGNDGHETIVYRNGGNGAKPMPINDHAHDARLPVREPVRRAVPDAVPIARQSAASADIIAGAADLLRSRHATEGVTGLILERIDVDRRNGTLRCRTVLALGDQRYSAIAEVPDTPSAEAELAARVAVDALRAGGLTNAMLDGVGFITLGKTNYCVAPVREAGKPHRASAAPLIDSMAASATAAVLTALGSFTDARAKRSRAGH
jgi:hypothetical protein